VALRDVPSVVRFGNLHGVSTCPLTASGVEYVTYVQDTGFLAQDEKSPLLILTGQAGSCVGVVPGCTLRFSFSKQKDPTRVLSP